MKLERETLLYVVDTDGSAEMSLEQVVCAIQGGMKLEKVGIFTTPEEARVAERANHRRTEASRFENDDLLRAVRVVLQTKDGKEVARREFCPTA